MGITSSKIIDSSGPIGISSSDTKNSFNQLSNLKQNSLYNKFVIVWLDTNVKHSDVMYRNSVARFRRISSLINTFTNVNECLQYLNKMKDFKILMIINGKLVKEVWSQIKSMKHIHSIYIIADEEQNDEYFEKEFDKVKGIFDRVDPIFSSLKRDTRHIEQDSLGMSIIPSNYLQQNIKQMNSLFLYWFLVKQTIIDMKYDAEAYKTLAEFCRSHYADNSKELKIIDEFENSYQDHTPIWWYTRQCFLFFMLNRALQTQDIEVIIKMGPFIQDLHRQIEEIQPIDASLTTLYRSQCTTIEDFEKMKTTQGSLLSFHNFMLADSNYKTALDDVRRARDNVNAIPLLFRIELESTQNSTCFTSIKNSSYSDKHENYFLFSMHSIFRIVEIKQIEDQIWQITLKIINQDDKQLTHIKELIQENTRDVKEWYKLAKLMTMLREFDHAKEIYHVLTNLVPEKEPLKVCHIYNELGLISDELGDFRLALTFYQKALELQQKTCRVNHHLLSVAYNNIGEVQRQLGDYFKALSYHQKTLSIKQKILSPQDLSLATTYNNLGLANQSLGEYSTALEFYEKSLEIKRKTLPVNHIDFVITYNNMGELQREMGKFSSALKYLDKVLQIRLKNCPPDDPSLAITYNNIGLIHREMGDFSQSITYLKKSLEIKTKSFTPSHPSFALTYNNIGEIHQLLGQYNEAIESYEKALEIQEHAFSANHPELAITYSNLGVAYQLLGNYSKALSFYQKALKIRQKSLPVNHPSLATSYNNIGRINQLMGEDNIALEYYEKTKKVQEKSLGPSHPSLATTYNNIGDIHRKMGNHNKALILYQKSYEIKKKSLALNHPSFVVTYNNLGIIYQALKQYPSALEFYKKTLELQQKTLPSDHPDLALIHNNIGTVHQEMEAYPTAIENYEKALEIQKKTISTNHPDLANTYHSMATAHYHMKNYEKSFEWEQNAVKIATESLSADHPHLQTFKNHLQYIQTIHANTKNK